MAELEVLYRVYPEIRDVVVEGRDDARRLRWYLRHHGVNAAVYAIDDRVSVPRNILVERNAERSNRARVVALADISNAWQLSQPTLTCVVDSDWDVLDPTPKPTNLLFTDGGAFETYCLQTRPLQKFLDLAVGRPGDADELIRLLVPALNELFVIRYVLHRFAEVSLPARIHRCIDVRPGKVVIDSPELIRRSLSAYGESQRQNDILSRLEEFRPTATREPMRAIRGHDIAPLLIHMLNLEGNWAEPKTVEGALGVCLEAEDLDMHDLFSELLRRLR